MNVVIIGAGVAGLSIGWRLLQAGAQVTILERGQPAHGATWAAAGMVAVTAELEDAAEPELNFAKQSNALWPDFVTELEESSGHRIGFSRSGSLMLARDAAALAVMRARADADPALTILDAAAARVRVPMLTGDVAGALWSADEAHLDTRALGEALTVAFLKAGGTLVANEAAVRIEQHGGRAVAVHTPYGRYYADAFLIAAGSWSGLLEDIPITPMKGEMIALAPPPDAALPGPVVWGNGVYLVPRKGLLLVGATMQEAGFDTSLTGAAREHLRARAIGLMASLKDWDLAEHWAGLRPRSPDGLPLLGPSHIPGLFVATGQFRNGILFAPAIAALMAHLLLGRGALVAAFDPRRFAEGNAP